MLRMISDLQKYIYIQISNILSVKISLNIRGMKCNNYVTSFSGLRTKHNACRSI